MNVKKFDSLHRRDFDNGAILDEIRTMLKVLAALVAEIDACETVGDWAFLTSGDTFQQARAFVGAGEGGDGS